MTKTRLKEQLIDTINVTAIIILIIATIKYLSRRRL